MSYSKGKTAKGGKEAFIPYIPFDHEEARDLIYQNLSFIGMPIDEKCDFLNKANKKVYNYFVKVLKVFNNNSDDEVNSILNIMWSQSTMSHFEALKTKNMNLLNIYIVKINFDDKSKLDIKSLDGKIIFGITLKYGEKISGDFLHRSITFNIANFNMNALYDQTINIANKINDMLNGKVTQVIEPEKAITILKKPDSFPVLSKNVILSKNAKAFIPPVDTNEASAAPVSAPVVKAEVKTEVKAEAKAEVKTMGEMIKIIETNNEDIEKLNPKKIELEKEISSFDIEKEKFITEMKQKLEDGIKALDKKKEENEKNLNLINGEIQSKINENEIVSNALIVKLSQTSKKSWADED